ncbi:hypothetical protein [Flavilitoribacter nigricans]|uniref:Uncharacterized protein n=1 Tax=Flavilitoribacter nigricans (strain ATCC 23147 / DSM 23189 / NBRC 102662 / NCIMB 1420 / SS-2) TaxID=1122177 RepID=A0A2D0NDJ0_FLAN2|nr:hypothetical protein [Flavilitoribacter nigricans]PHN06584.1 hypothetical protein CRP01_09775 [Flavilitoribacter nigricans DSM 23189 = NBRC 102662]
MTLSGQQLFNIGVIYWGILLLSLSLGVLRINRVLLFHFLLSSALLYVGIMHYPLQLPCRGNENGAGFLFGPFAFVVSYAMMRWLYKRIYNFEPDIEAYSGYSSRDNRGLNFLDYLTALIPAVLSSIVSIILAN